MRFKLDFAFNSSCQISIQNSQLMMGSCFAEEIGQLLTKHRFDVTVNPHGVIFNPLTLAGLLSRYVTSAAYAETDILQHQERYYSLQHHGRFSSDIKDELLQRMNDALYLGSTAVQRSEAVLITFGSAWVYTYLTSGNTVANCHKLPAQLFSKRLLSVSELTDAWQPVLQALKKVNKQVVFTVSPVRYIRDGLHENNISKSVLQLSVHELCSQFDHVHYFPAYEIVSDELRDYRFFKEDLVHPNQQAITYVFERFVQTSCTPHTQQAVADIRAWLLMQEHRPVGYNMPEQTAFIQKRQHTAEALHQKYPFLGDRGIS
ncbi:MAG: GSCFA domain-containing protein [Bacteroidota bacterium]